MRIRKRAQSLHLADDAAGTLLIRWNDGTESTRRTGDRFDVADIVEAGELRPGIRRVFADWLSVHVFLD